MWIILAGCRGSFLDISVGLKKYQSYSLVSAVVGAVAWVIALFIDGFPGSEISWLPFLFCLAPLVVLPLGLVEMCVVATAGAAIYHDRTGPMAR